MAVETGRIVKDGMEMEYFRFGKGEKPLAVIPGLSVKSILLYKDAVADALSLFGEGFDVYVFDRRADLPDDYTVADMANDQIKAFEALGLKDISVYGISQGGMIALTAAIMRPDFIRCMVLGSTCARLDETSRAVIREWNALAAAKDEDGLIEAFVKGVYSPSFAELYGDAIRGSMKGITDTEFERLAVLTGKMNEYDVSGRLGEVKCPVLIMCGDKDMVLGSETPMELSAITNSEMYVFKGEGHAVYDETVKFREKANEFFSEI